MRSGAWNHTAAIVTHLRLAAGDKDAKFEAFHPDTASGFHRKRLNQFSKKVKGE
jgi:hypothetical protein